MIDPQNNHCRIAGLFALISYLTLASTCSKFGKKNKSRKSSNIKRKSRGKMRVNPNESMFSFDAEGWRWQRAEDPPECSELPTEWPTQSAQSDVRADAARRVREHWSDERAGSVSDTSREKHVPIGSPLVVFNLSNNNNNNNNNPCLQLQPNDQRLLIERSRVLPHTKMWIGRRRMRVGKDSWMIKEEERGFFSGEREKAAEPPETRPNENVMGSSPSGGKPNPIGFIAPPSLSAPYPEQDIVR